MIDIGDKHVSVHLSGGGCMITDGYTQMSIFELLDE